MSLILKYNKRKFLAILLLTMVVFGLQQAKADFISRLNVGNPDISGFPAPYGTVTISLNGAGTEATVTFTALDSYLFGAKNAVDLNVNGPFTLGTITDNGAGTFTRDLIGGSQVDGFGDFNLRISATDGFPDAASVVSFTLTGNWTSADTVLTFNSGGGNPGGPFDAAAHIFAGGATGVTGFAGEGPGGVPDGGTTAMFMGLGLTTLGLVRRFLIG